MKALALSFIEPENAMILPLLSYINPSFSWNIPTVLSSSRKAIFMSNRPAAIKLLSKFSRAPSNLPFGSLNSRNNASLITSSRRRIPSLIASISSGNSLGEAIIWIEPPFSTRPQMPAVSERSAEDEKNPTARLYVTACFRTGL